MRQPAAKFMGYQCQCQRCSHSPPCAKRVCAIVCVSENCHQAVARELEVTATVLNNGLAGLAQVLGKQIGHLAGIELCRQC